VGTWEAIPSTFHSAPPPVRFEADGENGIRHQSTTGYRFPAQFDGKDYPVTGSTAFDAISIRRLDSHTLEETRKKGGVVVQTNRLTVSPDGRTLTVVLTPKNTQGVPMVTTHVHERQ
jgi:hypothetical protein